MTYLVEMVFSINGWGCTSHINKLRNMIHKWDVKFDNKMCNAAENLLFYPFFLFQLRIYK